MSRHSGSFPVGRKVGDDQQPTQEWICDEKPGRAFQPADSGDVTCFIHITQPDSSHWQPFSKEQSEDSDLGGLHMKKLW